MLTLAGTHVRMTESFKALMMTASPDHVNEFGECVGVVEDPVYPGHPEWEWNVRWMPSGLRYGYDLEWLEEVKTADSLPHA